MTDKEDPTRNRIGEANGSDEPETYGPAYQRLRETLRELIGETDAEEIERDPTTRTRRRRNYVEPERAGVLRQSDNSDEPLHGREIVDTPRQARSTDERPDGWADDRQPAGAAVESDESDEAAPSQRPAAGLQRIIRSRTPRHVEASDASYGGDDAADEAGDANLKSSSVADQVRLPRTLASALRHGDPAVVPAGAAAASSAAGQQASSGDDRYLEPEPAPIPVSRKPIGQLARSRRRKTRADAEFDAAAADHATAAERSNGGRRRTAFDDDDVNDDDALWHGKAPKLDQTRRSSKGLMLVAAFGASVLIGAGIYLGVVMGRAPSPPVAIVAQPKPAAETIAKSVAENSPTAKVAVEAGDAAANSDAGLDDQPEVAEAVETIVTGGTAAKAVDAPADVLPSAALEEDPPAAAAKPELPAKPVAESVAIEPEPEAAAEAAPKPALDADEPAAVVPPSAVGSAEAPGEPQEQVAAAVDAQPVDRSVPIGSSETDATADDAAAVDATADAASAEPAAEPEAAASDQVASAGDAAAAPPSQPSAPVGSSDSSVEQVGILTTAPPAAADGCEPSIEVFPRPAGFSRISVRSECRKDELVRFTYGGVVFNRRLDANGTLDIDIDCFLGLSHTVDIAFKDGSVYEATLVADDIDKVAKIAVVWNQPIDLDLHAFEDGAPFNDPRHLWNSRPGSYATALQAIASSGRGHGFLSSIADARGNGSRFEVYTYLYPPQRNTGFVKFSVDYQTRGARPFGASCGTGVDAKPGFQVIYTIRGGQAIREFSEFAAVPCGQALSETVRFATDLLPELNVAK